MDQLTTDLNETENEAVTGQLGFRYTKFRDRFTFSTDFRAFAGVNYQNARVVQGVTTVVYDNSPVTQGDEVDRILRSVSSPIYERHEDTFLGFDVRGEVALSNDAIDHASRRHSDDQRCTRTVARGLASVQLDRRCSRSRLATLRCDSGCYAEPLIPLSSKGNKRRDHSIASFFLFRP